MIRWLRRLIQCRHRHGFEYECGGGKGCPYNQCECEGGYSVPVYDVSCPDCGKIWTLGEDELIDFFARRRKNKDEIN